jgi:3-oxoacyl-[acyl-carrier-protein] synthase II
MRVFVTGVGIVSPLAIGAERTMDRLVSGARAFRRVTLFDTADQRTNQAAEVTDLSVADVAPAADRASWSRTDAMAAVAAKEALAAAGLDPARTDVDLTIGGTTGGMFETEHLLAEMHRDPSRREPLALMLSHPLSATSDRLRAALGPLRRARSVCSACSGGANAILLAADWIRAGNAHRVLAGGADGLCRLTFTGFNALSAVAPDVCRPFDRRRSGLGLGEGAAFLVLESEISARERGREPIAELAGWGVGSEAHHITIPEKGGETAAALVTKALARGGLSPRELDYVNAHGTGTPLNDAMEAAALRKALGKDCDRIAVSTCKGQIGHTLGAAGAIEAAVTVLAIARGELPPTGGLEDPDPECNLAHVIGKGRKAKVSAALSNSFGFGGTDTVLLFTLPRFAKERPGAPKLPRIVVTGGATLGALGLRGLDGSLAYLEPGAPPSGESLVFNAKDHFDLDRARRMDRSARLLTMAMQLALREASVAGPPSDLGAVSGSAYGGVDSSAEFIQRIYEKGGRLASPMVFPNLVPSSPVGHAAIYLGVRGPVLSTADLGVTGEAAFALACELLEAGEARAILAGGVEEHSAITERVLGPVCSGSASWTGVRTEGSSVVLLEDEPHAVARGAKPLARVLYVASGRGPFPIAKGAPPSPSERALPAPRGRAVAVVARRDEPTLAALASTEWSSVPVHEVASRAGNQEGVGGFGLVAAAATIAAGRADSALVLGLAPDRWAAIVLSGT